MYTYTLGFIKKNEKILMINRKKKPWMGCWNGLGGKIIQGEDPMMSLIRELKEETGLTIEPSQIKDGGYLTWNTFDANGQGLYLYLIEMRKEDILSTPIKTDEGILDWKHIDWIIDSSNFGVAHNIKHFLPTLLSSSDRYHYHCTFEADRLLSVSKERAL